MNIIDNLENNSKEFPNKIAIVFEEQKISYKELHDQVKKISLKINELDKGVISLISENSILFIITYLGIIRSGRIAHLVPPEISEINFNNQIKSADSQTIICSESTFHNIVKFAEINIPILKISELKEQLKNKENYLKENQIAHLIFTSGTTATPKGVGITHSMLNFTTKNIIGILGYLNSDIDILPLPLYHSFGLGCVYTSLTVGSTIILHKDASNLENLLNSIKKHNATTFAAIPATLIKFLKSKNIDLKNYFLNIRLIITNSTSISKETVQNYKQILKNGNIATYYGLTEASRSTFMVFKKNSSRDESVGKSAPGVSIKIDNDEILIKGKNVISQYWKNDIADKNITDSWLRTGDIGFLDNENYLFLKGRKDDIINIGGEKVSPFEIEEVVKEIPEVIDVAAFGIKNEIFGQVIKLHIIKSKELNLDKSKILIHCIKNLEKFKIPNKIDFVEEIPKTSYGKVKRFMLK
jgi:long-chain acyl-CoA synthetase